MSVIVKGMEMPKNCSECRMWSICTCLNDFEDYESICYAVDDGDLVRADDCPLIELPFAEELAEKLYKQIEKAVIEAEGETDGR